MFFAWRKEHKKNVLASAFEASLKSRCDYVIVEWQNLGELYQNSAKEEGQPATLQGPMEPGWVSSGYRVWPYRIGVLQAYTISLRQDLHGIGLVETGDWNVRISLSELVETLRSYRDKITHLAR